VWVDCRVSEGGWLMTITHLLKAQTRPDKDTGFNL